MCRRLKFADLSSTRQAGIQRILDGYLLYSYMEGQFSEDRARVPPTPPLPPPPPIACPIVRLVDLLQLQHKNTD
jgi:hypothetical protein